jgi:adenine-specific DNA-methyltransferase
MGLGNRFDYPKSIGTLETALWAQTFGSRDFLVLDYFGGSGTTGHALIRLNQQDGGRRRVLLSEVGAHFLSVLVPRLKKAAYCPEWKDGKPKRLATPEEADRSPRIMKIVRLESYEDTLNNLDIHRSNAQKSLLDEPAAQGDGKLREQYLLKYMLDVETRGSQSLLNVAAFRDPTAYRLSVKRPGSDESREVCVDLLETFNWLIGLTVEAIAAPQVFFAAFERDADDRLQLQGGRIKPDPKGPFWFRRVEGKLPDGRRALIVWRKLGDDLEQANLVLDHFLTDKLKISTKDFEFDVIYVNGSTNLENLKTGENNQWKVRLLEEEFHRLMFATEDV